MKKYAELLIDAKAELGEGPAWDADNGLLYWVDILGENIHTYHPKTDKMKTIHVGQHVGAVVPTEGDTLIAALQSGIYIVDLPTENLHFIDDPESHLPNNRFNDGKCDPLGRFLAGTMSYNSEQGAGSFYKFEHNRDSIKLIDQVTISNGFAWNPALDKMYFIDTPTREVVVYDYDLETGEIMNKQVVFHIPEEMGFPDGMTSDVNGNLWIAHWGGHCITCWDPNTKTLLRTIDVPAPQVTSCVFGGKEMNELFITTARVGLSQEVLEKYPHSGGVFRIETDVKGSPTYKYRMK